MINYKCNIKVDSSKYNDITDAVWYGLAVILMVGFISMVYYWG